MKVEKYECSYQVTECDLKFGEQITLDGELLIPVSVLDRIRAEIDKHKSTIDKAISEDELKIEGMKEAYTDCLEIIDKYKEERSKR